MISERHHPLRWRCWTCNYLHLIIIIISRASDEISSFQTDMIKLLNNEVDINNIYKVCSKLIENPQRLL